MFTGFASENTPAIQVWDLFNTLTGTNRIALADDCAPIQYFKTGGTGTAINVYLPSAPIEGKQIKICSAKYGSSDQNIQIYASDRNAGGTSSILITIGAGQTLDLCYSKSFISLNSAGGIFGSGWIFLNQAPVSAVNYRSVVAGGNSNYATAPHSVVSGGNLNTSSGEGSVICGGVQNTVSGVTATVNGGTQNSAGGESSAVSGGQGNNASASFAIVAGGNSNTSNGQYSAVIGGQRGTTRSITGNFVAPASAVPIASVSGVSQSALLLLGVATTDATATRLRSNTSAATTTNQVILPNNSAYVFQGTCIANVTGGSTTSGWKYEGVIKRGANAGTTALVAAVTPTVIAQDLAAATWVLAITADTTNGGIAVTVTGAAATTIRWVSTIETTEVTF